MTRLCAFVSVAALAFLLLPAAATAGWAGSRYEKSECTLDVGGNDGRPFLYCESTFIDRYVLTEEVTVADASCPSGARLLRREHTFEETWRVFDIYTGPVPVVRFNFAGNEHPISLPRLVSTITTALGCAP